MSAGADQADDVEVSAAIAARGCNCKHLPEDATCAFCRRQGRLAVDRSHRDPTKAPAEAFAHDRLTRRRGWWL